MVRFLGQEDPLENPWRRERLPTPVFWPGEFHGVYSSWSHKESDTTEQLSLSHTHTHTHTSIYLYLSIYNGILFSNKRNEIMSFVATWINLEIMTLSEISQEERYHVLSLVYVESKTQHK